MKKLYRIIGLLLVAGTLMATETRVATMGGDINLLLNEEQSIFAYPGAVMSFGQLATLEFGTLPSWGMGVYPAGMLILGNDRMKVALLGNRPIYTNNHPTNPMTLNAYGVVFGMGLGNLNVGFLVNLAMRQRVNTPAANTTYSYNTLFLGVTPGFSFRTRSMGIDASLAFNMQNWKDEGYTVTVDTFKFSGSPLIGLNTRFYTGSRRKKIIGAFGFNYFKDAYDHNGTTFNNGTNMNINAELGTCVRPMRGSKMVGGVNLNLNSVSTSDTSGATAINAGFVLGGETMVSSRFGLRAGVNRTIFSYNKNKNGAVSNSTMRFADAPLNVTVGAYMKIRNVRIDANIAQDLLFNGPFFITGTPSRLAGTISAIASF